MTQTRTQLIIVNKKMLDNCLSSIDYKQFDTTDEEHKQNTEEIEKSVLSMQKSEENISEENDDDSGVSRMWKEFKDATTLHGLKHAGSCGQYRIRGWIWLIAVLCMAGCLIYTVSNLYAQYHQYKTNTNLNAELLDKLPFPAVTVCNLSPFKNTHLYSNEILKQYFISNSILGKHDLPIPSRNISEMNASSVLNSSGNSSLFQNNLGSILKFCRFEGKDVCLYNIKPRITSFGKCFTFNPWNGSGTIQPLTTQKTGSRDALIMYLQVGQEQYTHSENIAAGFKIVIHDPKDEPDVESEGFLVSPGFSTFAALRMTKKIYQPKPYMAFGDKHCVDVQTDDFVNPLKYHSYYSYYGCIRECRESYILKQCGCRDYTHLGNAAICSFRKINECVRKYANKFEGEDDLKNSLTCECFRPCTATRFEIQTSFAYFPSDINSQIMTEIGFKDIRKDYMEVRIYYDSLTLLKIQQIPQYTIDGIIGTLGGQMGLFLGASLLTVSEFLEFCLLLLLQVARKVFKRNSNCDRNSSNSNYKSRSFLSVITRSEY